MSVNGALRTDPQSLLRLIQFCDSALPIGAYSQSWGLEAYITRGSVRRPAELDRWVRRWLESTVAPGEGILVVQAWHCASRDDWEGVASLNDLLTVNRVAESLRNASFQQGEALLNLTAGWPWSGHASALLRATNPGPWHHAIVFGALAHPAGASVEETIALYLQNAATGVVSAAVRGVPIGHTHGQQILARLHPLLNELAEVCVRSSLDQFGGFSPRYEVMCDAQTQLYTRIFQS